MNKNYSWENLLSDTIKEIPAGPNFLKNATNLYENYTNQNTTELALTGLLYGMTKSPDIFPNKNFDLNPISIKW